MPCRMGLPISPVHTSRFRSDHDSATMHYIAEAYGGTFSFLGAEVVFDAAIEWWSSNMGEKQQTLELIMHETTSFHLKHKKLKAATDLFDQLVFLLVCS